MGRTDKPHKRKKILLVRNVLLAVLSALVVADAAWGYCFFTGKIAAQEGKMESERNEEHEKTDIPEESGETEETSQPEGTKEPGAMTLFIVLTALLVADLATMCGLTVYTGRLRREKNMEEHSSGQVTELQFPVQSSNLDSTKRMAVQVGPAWFGKAHNIGNRTEQQDSFGKAEVFCGKGILAVVADGMGGLKGGGQVSQQVVMEMLNCAARLKAGSMDGILPQMVRQANEKVNHMLGEDGLYKSGSTLVAVLAAGNYFHWISVGDSRIYLYREGCLLQVNQEHTQVQEWMPDILDGRISYAEAVRDPEGRKLTSFIGMGRLKHIDCSLRSVRIAPGDRILLMTDGVFGTLPEEKMESILSQYEDTQQAASGLEQAVMAAGAPGQDNFTVVVLGF